jgi:hypothetical protein
VLAADQLHFHALAEALGHLSRDARKGVHHTQKRCRAQVEHATLQLADVTLDAIEASAELGIVGQLGGRRSQLAGAEDDFADRAEEAVERVSPDANRAGRSSNVRRARARACRARRLFARRA